MESPTNPGRFNGEVNLRFVGREGQLGALRGGLARLGSGQGGGVFVLGEPGIGKSALIREFGRQALTDGVAVCGGMRWPTWGPQRSGPGFEP